MQNDNATFENSLEVSYKLKLTLAIKPSNPILTKQREMKTHVRMRSVRKNSQQLSLNCQNVLQLVNDVKNCATSIQQNTTQQ